MTVRHYVLTNDAYYRMSLERQERGWTDAAQPSREELEALCLRFGFPRHFLAHALDPKERPRAQRTGEFALFVLHASHPSHSSTPFDTVPLVLIQLRESVLTVCEHHHTVLSDLKAGRLSGVDAHGGHRFALHLFWRVAQRYLQDLAKLSAQVEDLERDLERSTRNAELLRLMRIQKSLVYFKASLIGNRGVLRALPQTLPLSGEERAFLEEVLVEFEQALELTDIELHLVGNLLGAIGSVVSNNVNHVMRLFTLVTVLLALPTWITGLFGTNVPIPGQTQGWSFFLVLGLCLGSVLVVLWLLRRSRWL